MPQVITLDRIRVQNVQVYKQSPDGVLPRVPFVNINYVTENLTGDRMPGARAFELTGTQAAQIRDFLSTFMDTIRTDLDIQITEDEI